MKKKNKVVDRRKYRNRRTMEIMNMNKVEKNKIDIKGNTAYFVRGGGGYVPYRVAVSLK